MKVTKRAVLVMLPILLLAACATYEPTPARPREPVAQEPIKPGIEDASPQWANYVAYLQTMCALIQAEFDRLNDESRVYPPAGSRVAVRFVLTDEGKIARIISIDNQSSEAAAKICTSALILPSPYDPWTADMKAKLGHEQELTFEFLYK